jgi:hypothetical protein
MDMKSHMLIFILKSMLVDIKNEWRSYKIESVATLLGKSVKMKLKLPKWELGSPLGLLKLQNSIAGVKTPRTDFFLYHWKAIDV